MGRSTFQLQDPLPLLTARTRLRRLATTDLGRFQAYRHDPAVGQWQGWAPQDDAGAVAFLQEMAEASFCPEGRWFQIGIADSHSDALIGDIGLQVHGSAVQVAEIGFTLSAAAQGRGLAGEAVGALAQWLLAQPSVQRLVAVADLRNTASGRLLARLGFRPYAELPAQFRGQPCVERHWVRHRSDLPPVRLRPAAAADAPALAALMRLSRRVLLPFLPQVHSDEDQARWVAEVLLPGGGVTVAERSGQPVGLLALRLAGASVPDARAATPRAAVEAAFAAASAQIDTDAHWIDQLYLHPAACASGVGQALLRHALARCAQQQPRRPVRLWTFQANTHALAFYERQGFVAIARSDGADNEEHCPDVLLQHE